MNTVEAFDSERPADYRDGGETGGAVQPVRHQRPGLDRARRVQTDLSGHGHRQGERESDFGWILHVVNIINMLSILLLGNGQMSH